ncbi:MAG: hypothetical protein V4633_06460 [Pseudomonadota bacterium]
MKKRAAFLSGSFFIVLFLAGCSYGHQNFSQQGGKFSGPDDYVVQVDDYGQFWDRPAAESVLKEIEKKTRDSNTVVVLFIHGWHHNAKIDDANAIDFSNSVLALRKKLDGGVYKAARKELTGRDDIKVISVYVGWRGESLYSYFDYLTFWGRKAAAERVGEGDLREFLLTMNNIYRQRNVPNQDTQKRPFMGMTTFGHSFGGQVLMKAVAGTLEQELIEKKSRQLANPHETGSPLLGFGDLVVLLNPALEALQFERINRLSQELKYDARQLPLFLVLSAENDKARQVLFPIGRSIASIGRAQLKDKQSAMWKTTLGEYKEQRTHALELKDDGKMPAAMNLLNSKMYESACAMIKTDLSALKLHIGELYLIPKADRLPYHPYLVTYVDGEVIIKHRGIFEAELGLFLNDYIAAMQGKRMLLANPKYADCYKA